MPEAKFTATLGRMFWEAARQEEKAINAVGGNLRHEESPGALERDFTFKGDEHSVQTIFDYLRKLSEQQ